MSIRLVDFRDAGTHLTLSLRDKVPSIELHKPYQKNITIQVADDSSIKLINGGVKSKTITVD